VNDFLPELSEWHWFRRHNKLKFHNKIIAYFPRKAIFTLPPFPASRRPTSARSDFHLSLWQGGSEVGVANVILYIL